MDEYYKNLIEDVRATYRDIVTGPKSRITRGAVLWDLFEQAAAACESGSKAADRQLGERINELAVAKLLADDPKLTGSITYEPDFLPDGRKIDFVADRGDDNLYVEVKTVHPDVADTEAAWDKYVERRKRHPENADFVAHKDWMGGRLYKLKCKLIGKIISLTRNGNTRTIAHVQMFPRIK